ncbi:MAG: hypothetical protein NWR03_07860 [Akkermansiaceae bacterium]|nr:hypothetical protein [Akkermansiaceae bacterium]
MTFSLLLHALDPKPDRKALEEILVGVSSITRADSAGILSDWFGIVSSGRSIQDAHAFQTGLRTLGCESDIVPDDEIPALHSDFRCHIIDLDAENITLTTAMNRRQHRSRSELVFAAAGVVERARQESDYEMQTEVRYTHNGAYTVPVEKRISKTVEKDYFRIDLFFANAPHRVSLEMDKDSVILYGDRHIRLRNTTELTVLMCDLQTLLPPDRQNLALRTLSTEPLYPSLHGYEEEIRWMFYLLGAKG